MNTQKKGATLDGIRLDICNETSPELIRGGDDHFSACWRLNEIPSIANRTHGRGE